MELRRFFLQGEKDFLLLLFPKELLLNSFCPFRSINQREKSRKRARKMLSEKIFKKSYLGVSAFERRFERPHRLLRWKSDRIWPNKSMIDTSRVSFENGGKKKFKIHSREKVRCTFGQQTTKVKDNNFLRRRRFCVFFFATPKKCEKRPRWQICN